MAYNIQLADKVREYLSNEEGIEITEKKMFSGLAFLVNGKMCVNVSGDNLMCRFDPALHETLAERTGYRPMIMRGKELSGYCYVASEGFRYKKDFDYWMKICLDFNEQAKPAKKKKK